MHGSAHAKRLPEGLVQVLGLYRKRSGRIRSGKTRLFDAGAFSIERLEVSCLECGSYGFCIVLSAAEEDEIGAERCGEAAERRSWRMLGCSPVRSNKE